MKRSAHVGITYERLADYCEFDVIDPTRVYLLVSIARAKENENISNGEEIVFREVARNEQDLLRKNDKLCSLAANYTGSERPHSRYTWRHYVTVNARDAAKAFFAFDDRRDQWLHDWVFGNEDTHRQVRRKMARLDSQWKSELQRPVSRLDKRFLYDLDETGKWTCDVMVNTLSQYTDIITTTPTPNGYHIVTEPFNYTEMDKTDAAENIKGFDYEHHTDGLLYVGTTPNSEVGHAP